MLLARYLSEGLQLLLRCLAACGSALPIRSDLLSALQRAEIVFDLELGLALLGLSGHPDPAGHHALPIFLC